MKALILGDVCPTVTTDPLFKAKDKEALIELIKQKHTWENTDNIPVLTKKNDLIMWNVDF